MLLLLAVSMDRHLLNTMSSYMLLFSGNRCMQFLQLHDQNMETQNSHFLHYNIMLALDNVTLYIVT